MGYLQAGQYESLAIEAANAMQDSGAYKSYQRAMAKGGNAKAFANWSAKINAGAPKPTGFAALFASYGKAQRTPTDRGGFPAMDQISKALAQQQQQQRQQMMNPLSMWAAGGAQGFPQTTSGTSAVVSPGETQVIRPSQQPQQMRRQAPSASTDGSLLTGQDAMGMGTFGASSLLGG
jgi:hypothetical protein